MKKTLSTLTLIIITLCTYAQMGKGVGAIRERLKNEKVMVVLKNDEGSKLLKKAIEESWTVSKYEFILEEELSSKYSDKSKVLLLGIFDGA